MKSDQTFSIDIIYRRCKADKTRADLLARITVNGDSKELSLKSQVLVKDWDSKTETVRGRNIEAKTINDTISEVRNKLRIKYRELERSEVLITAAAVKAAYTGVQDKLRGHTMVELMNYFATIWEQKLAPGNYKNYKTTMDYLRLFLSAKFEEGDIYLSQLDGEFATNFEHFVRTSPIKEHDPCKGNGVGKHLQRFKRILNWAADEIGWIKINPIAKYKCGIKKSRRKKLTLEQVFHLEDLPHLPPELHYVRDLFICSCYTGLAYVDVMALTMNDIEEGENEVFWLKVYRKKSDELSAVPLLTKASQIIRKYLPLGKGLQAGTIFPYLTNQYVNRQLKVIQLIAGIPLKLTFHLARHTFAKTIALKHGVPLETVQILLGHTKITTTQIYADVDEEKILADTEGLEERIEQKKILMLSIVNQRKKAIG